MSKKHRHDPKRNARLAWLANNIVKGRTDASIILECMTAFKCSEQVARADLKAIYQRYADIHTENLPEQKVKLLEVAWQMLDDMRAGYAFGPAANQFKTIATMLGTLTEGGKQDNSPTEQTTPKPDIVRDRISLLLRDPKVREKAQRLGLDLDKASDSSEED